MILSAHERGGDSKTELSEDLRSRLLAASRVGGHECSEIELRREEVPHCTGCLLCVTKHPGKCVYEGRLAEIIEKAAGCSRIYFLTPVRFGTFSSTIKDVIDRGGLVVKSNGECEQVVIGYSEDASEAERRTFVDLTAKHRGRADIVHPQFKERFEVFFTATVSENEAICARLAC